MISSRIAQFLFLIFVFTFSGCDTKDDFEDSFKNYFIKYYGEDWKQEGVDMIVNNDDGTLLLLGNSISGETTEGVSQVFLVKTDLDGNIIWQKKTGGLNETAVDIEPALTAGMFVVLSNVLTGKNATTGLNQYYTKLSIINAEGVVQDSTEVPTPVDGKWQDQVGYSVTPILGRYTAGGYMITGNTSDTKLPPPDLSEIIVIFYNANLSDTIWTQSDEAQHVGTGVKVFESDTYGSSNKNDRPFYLFGYSDKKSRLDIDLDNNFWCMSLDENAIKSGDDFSGDPDKEEVMSETIKAIGSGFISVGTQTSSATDKKSIVLTKAEVGGLGLRFSSQLISVKESRNLEAVSITPSIIGGRYLILSNEISATGNTNIWLSKVDIEGNVYWSASFGSVTKNDFGGTVRELPDGKILILGTMELESQNSKMALIKLNANGELLN
jgi:hypothetical protein